MNKVDKARRRAWIAAALLLISAVSFGQDTGTRGNKPDFTDVPTEIKRAFEEIQKAARAGIPEAQLRLGMFYWSGEMGAPQDYHLALHWFRLAAEQGNTEAMYHLGLANERGLGTAINLVEALNFYRQAARDGSILPLRSAALLLRGPTAAERKVYEAELLQYRELAMTAQDPAQATGYREQAEALTRYLDQSNAIRDLEQAARFFREAAEKGDPWSRREWARAMLKGSGIPAEPKRAVELLAPLAHAGDPEAQLLSADAWSGQYEGIPADQEKMFDYLWQAAAAEETEENLPVIAEAMTKVAWCYQNGIVVAMDPALAERWYRRAAERGAAPAMINLGHKYATGDGVPQNEQTAFEWYRQAARADHPLGWFNLGVCWAEGKGVATDDEAALRAFRVAANAGVVPAQYNLAHFYLDGRGGPANPAEAVRWFRQAAERGDGPAMLDLALCYLDGTGVAADRAKAREWLEKAAERGAPTARELLEQHFRQAPR